MAHGIFDHRSMMSRSARQMFDIDCPHMYLPFQRIDPEIQGYLPIPLLQTALIGVSVLILQAGGSYVQSGQGAGVGC